LGMSGSGKAHLSRFPFFLNVGAKQCQFIWINTLNFSNLAQANCGGPAMASKVTCLKRDFALAAPSLDQTARVAQSA
ncbi:hypothetical protein, partial [Pseudovibrio sp. WM33]|uniref:hypothetical protein n=1 Tax=Pseudovibrio sp. WM33 TaxID=1735585 RepID=UPI0019D40A39